jgi:hypothetical protein
MIGANLFQLFHCNKKIPLEQKLRFVQLNPILPLERIIISQEQMEQKKCSIATSRKERKRKEKKRISKAEP